MPQEGQLWEVHTEVLVLLQSIPELLPLTMQLGFHSF